MRKYFLVSYTLDSKSIGIVCLEEEWYLGAHGKGGYLSNSLEAIDMFTSQFENKEKLNDFLSENTAVKIDKGKAEFFIVSVDEKNQLIFDNVIYSLFNSSKNRAQLLKNIGLANMADFKEEGMESSVNILKAFLLLFYSTKDFYSMVCDLETGLEQEFVDTFKGIVALEDFSFELDDAQIFAIKDYRTVRNMVEAMNRLEEISLKTRDNRDLYNQDLVLFNAAVREKYSKDIKELLNYIGEFDQGSLLYTLSTTYDKRRISEERYRKEHAQKAYRAYKKDYVKKEELEYVPKKHKRVEAEERITPAIIPNVDDRAKVSKIRNVLDKLPEDVFLYRKSEDRFIFNDDVFNCPVHEDDEKILSSTLKGTLPLLFLKYARSKHEYRRANESGFNLLEYEQVIRDNWSTINNKFKSKTNLDNAYKWCVVYNEYRKRSADFSSYGQGGEQIARGKVFEKK